MKLKYFGRAAWAGAVSAGIVLGIAACGQDNTIDYLFVANAKNNPGQINVYLVDSESGKLKQIADSPYPSGATPGGRNPVALATVTLKLANGKEQPYLYALNHDDDSIVQFAVGTDAKLYPEKTYNTPGGSPTSMKINAAGTYLYVVDAFQPQYNATNPGPGDIVVYPISQADGSLGSPVVDTATGTDYFPTCNNPVDLTVLDDNAFVYVIDDPAGQPPKIANTVSSSNVGANGTSVNQYVASPPCTAASGQISAFAVQSDGTLSQVAGSPFAAGTTPTAIIGDPTSSVVYAVDYQNNALLTFTAASNGTLTPVASVATGPGQGPNALTMDASGSYLYVADYSGTVSIFAVGSVPGTVTSASSFGVNSGPTYVYIEPSAGEYLYTAGFLDNTVYGAYLNPSTGILSSLQNDPFGAAGQPTAIAATIHRKYAQQ